MIPSILDDTAAARAANLKTGNLPPDFMWFELFIADSVGTLGIRGAQMRAAKSGPRKGEFVKVIPGTTITVYVSREDCAKCQH